MNTIKTLLISIFMMILGITSSKSQSYDAHIADAINKSDWFALDSICHTTPTDSIDCFIETFARCITGNRFNRPDVSIPAFEELFNKYASSLDLNNTLNSVLMYAMDLNRVGNNEKASSILMKTIDATKQHLNSETIEKLQSCVDMYSALSNYSPYGITFDNDNQGRIPFRIALVGPIRNDSRVMYLTDSSINGHNIDILFGTGAGVNIISDSLARAFDLKPLEASQKIAGVGIQSARYAIAKELKLGNIIITDVPFCITDISTNDREAGQYTDCFDIVVGSELMLRLKDMTIDFINREITVPTIAPTRSNVPANMCFSPGMNLLTKGMVHGNNMLINIDTGDATYGTLSRDFSENNKEYVTTYANPDSIRSTGIGGIHVSQCYNMHNMQALIGNNTITVPELTVLLNDSINHDFECNLGLKTIMLFDTVRFNLVDFVLTTQTTNNTTSNLAKRLPDLNYNYRLLLVR